MYTEYLTSYLHITSSHSCTSFSFSLLMSDIFLYRSLPHPTTHPSLANMIFSTSFPHIVYILHENTENLSPCWNIDAVLTWGKCQSCPIIHHNVCSINSGLLCLCDHQPTLCGETWLIPRLVMLKLGYMQPSSSWHRQKQLLHML